MQYFIGIDGGGSNTRCVLTDDKLNIIAGTDCNASNSLTAGFENSANIIFQLIKQICNEAGVEKHRNIVAGVEGYGSLLINKNYYSRELKRKIDKSIKHVKVIKPKYPPVIGAVKLEKKLFIGEN